MGPKCKTRKGAAGILAASLVIAWMVSMTPRAMAGQPGTFDLSPAQLAADEQKPPSQTSTGTSEAMPSRQETKATETTESHIPLKLDLSYALWSDYVFRGIRVTEYPHEGREKPVHEMTASLSWNAGSWGTFGFTSAFWWYSAIRQINPYAGGQHCVEVDLIPWWRYAIDPIKTDLTLGFIFKDFPKAAIRFERNAERGDNNDDRTQEWFVQLDHNDAWAWKWLFPENDKGILNPRFYFGQDIGRGAGSVWLELGVSHPFTIPGVDNLTITPGYTIAADGGYLRRIELRDNPGHLRLAYDTWSLNVAYDLTPVLHLPTWAGKLGLSGMLYYNNALGTAEDDGTIRDTLYGGMSVNWSWGG